MALNLLERIMHIFFSTESNALAVVDEKNGYLIGILYKAKLVRELSDINRAKNVKDSIPGDLMDFPSEEDILPIIEKDQQIPVINKRGEKLSMWGKVEIIKAFEKIPVPLVQNFRPEKVKIKEDDEILWFMDLVLKNIQFPLFATDLEGKTLFYNQPFEDNIWKKGNFRTIKSCENYFLRENRKLVSLALENNEDLNLPLKSNETINGFYYYMISLEYLSKTKGYLYEFYPVVKQSIPDVFEEQQSLAGKSSAKKKLIVSEEEIGGKEEEETEDSPSFYKLNEDDNALYELLFNSGKNYSLQELLDNFEKKIITLTLKHFQNNLSHAATFLALPRQTLQYHISKLFRENPVKVNSPVPRGRNIIAKKINKNNFTLKVEDDISEKYTPSAKEKKSLKKKASGKVKKKSIKKSKTTVKNTKPKKTVKNKIITRQKRNKANKKNN